MGARHWLKIFGNVGPALGALVLFGAWMLQQSLIQRAANELQQINHAQSVYRTYQSHNAVFNSIHELVKANESKSEQIRRYQTYNYELGLTAMDEALIPAEHHDVPSAPWAYDPRVSITEILNRTQDRLEKLQAKIKNRRDELNARQKCLNVSFVVIYIVGSVLALLGSAAKTIDSIAESRAAPAVPADSGGHS
jgi:hypothetical protein